MERIYAAVGSRKKRQVSRVELATVGYSTAHAHCLEYCNQALGNSLKLTQPDPTRALCVFMDASDTH
ncbi:hypothetical protein PsorP6_001320 [Peronosclerospora sorghi]|uniref:Uncharacterized protein n=1 Tax=Peronosclerospora sorghi TaxID=230839 RepID=A0ACC0WXI8_9STRA|nr:hypothetical protein PsorP6_001320 [Peronosclerospora sorghi]